MKTRSLFIYLLLLFSSHYYAFAEDAQAYQALEEAQEPQRAQKFFAEESEKVRRVPSNDFEEIFTVSGYATLLGAGVGVAALAFSNNPNKNARYVAIGAAIGFLSGCIFGSYLAIYPSSSLNYKNAFLHEKKQPGGVLDLQSSFLSPEAFVLELGVDSFKKDQAVWKLSFPVFSF